MSIGSYIINFIFSAALFVNALLFIPQAIKIYKTKTISGVSFSTFLGFLLIQFTIILHAIIVKDYFLMIGYMLSMLTCGTVVCLILRYRKNIKNPDFCDIDAEEILAQLPGNVYWKDKYCNFAGGNVSNLTSFGFKSMQDYLGKSDYDILPKEQADKLRMTDEEVMRTGKMLVAEEWCKNYNGQDILYLSYKVPLRNKKDKIVGLVGVSVDITQSKQDIVTRLTILEDIIAMIPGHIYWVDTTGTYLGCNDNQAKSAGLKSRAEIVGKRNKDLPWNFRAAELSEDLDKINKQVMETKQAIQLEEPATLIDGTKVVFLSNKVPLLKNNEVIGMVGISVDISELKETQKNLLQAKEAAEAANQAKTEFVQNMQHDIRTPAVGISSLLERFTESEKDPERREILKMATAASQRLLNLCNDAVEFGHLEQHAKPVTEQKIDIRDMALGVVDLNLPAVFGKGLFLHFTVDANVPTYIKSDPFRLSRILINLLGNAIKFTRKGEISIRLSVELAEDHRHGYLTIAIKDTGIGIASDKIQRIFEKFSRGIASNTNQYPGTGLGLYVVKTFVDELDGDIEVESREGEGTCFKITVPFKIPHTQQQKNEAIHKTYQSPLNALVKAEVPVTVLPKQTKAATTDKMPFEHHVLIIEDDAVCLYAEKDILSRFTQNIAMATTVKEALELLSENHYDLVISDLGLPDGSGTEMVARIRADQTSPNVHTSFVAMTAHRDQAKHKQAYDAGFNEVAVKPLTVEHAEGLLKFYDAAPNGDKGTEFDWIDPSELDAIDLEVTIERMNTKDVKSAFKGLGIFLFALEKDIPALQRAQQNNDITAIREILHKIRGALCYTGAPRLEKAVFDLHKALKSGADLTTMPKKFNLVYEEVDVFKEWYDALATADKEM